MASGLDALPRVYMRDRSAWRRWLSHHHNDAEGIWLVYDKKGYGDDTFTYAAIVEEALAFGWIDSRPRKLSTSQAMLLVTPRKAGSGWSKLNKERVARLERAGRLTPSGRRLVAQAKVDGSWDKLTGVQSLRVPLDLTRALRGNDAAARSFHQFPPSSKRIILEWIASAKRPETRQARIQETVRLAAKNIRANHHRQPKFAQRK